MKLPFNWKDQWIMIRRRWREFKKEANLTFHRIQDDLYEIDQLAHPYLRGLTVILSLLVVASILIPLGFEITPELVQLNREIEKWILLGFVINFLIRLLLTSNRSNFLRRRWFEALISVCSILILIDLTLVNLGIIHLLLFTAEHPEELFLRLLKGYLLLVVLIKLVQYFPELLERQKNTGRFIVYCFLSVIAAGTLLLMLPGATQDGEGLLFIDALFTSTSAVCVTGLIVVDTATHFTLLGELVILGLIQLGGIGIITFATFLFLFISGGLGVGQMNVLKNMVAEENTSLVTAALKKIIGFTFLAELAGFIGYYFSWSVEFDSHGQRILFSAFHAVSAFCNAGFSLFTNSLADPFNATNSGVNITTMILIVVGGLGFTVVWELISKSQKQYHWEKKLSVHTRTVLFTTVALIASGTLLILVMEWGNTLAGYPLGDKILISLFQSITTRTAGFNTLDIGAIGMSAILVMLVLMFIGGSPASTAGGIKTTTFAILIRSINMTVRGYSRMELYKRTITNNTIFRAMTVVLLSGFCITVSIILLSFTESQPFLALAFEEISAFATVGLSRGITAELTAWGKFIIIVSMFLGRVGILTFMVAIANEADNRKYRYPEETVMVT